jgi:thioredoxin-related protein
MKYILLFFSLTVFAQQPSEVFPVYSQPKSRPISIDKVIIHIRELKTKSSIKYGEAVDFYFREIVSAGKNQWLEKLEEFSQDPQCPAKNRIKINEYILRLRSLQIGEIAPDIVVDNYRLSNFKSEKQSILLLFYSPSCFHCTELLIDLIPYSVKKNLPVIALQIDEDMNPFVFPENWKSVNANAEIRKIYGVISTPTLFLLNSKSRRISAIPENLSEIKKSEHLF